MIGSRAQGARDRRPLPRAKAPGRGNLSWRLAPPGSGTHPGRTRPSKSRPRDAGPGFT